MKKQILNLFFLLLITVTALPDVTAGQFSRQKTIPQTPNKISRIDFIQEFPGKSKIKILTSRPVDFSVEKAGNSIIIKLPGAIIPPDQQRPLITTRFNSAADRISPLQINESLACILIELRESVPFKQEQDENALLIYLDASKIPPRPLAEAGLPDLKDIVEKLKQEKNAELEKPSRFTGEKITLDFYKTDIRNVFLILKEASGMNFALDKRVHGNVTMSFDKPVPWDMALEHILKMHNLESIRTGDIVRIQPVSGSEEEPGAAF